MAGNRLGKFGVGLVAAFIQSVFPTYRSCLGRRERTATRKVLATRLRLSDESGIEDNVLPIPTYEKVPDWADLAFDGMPEPISGMKRGTMVVWRNVSTTHRRRAVTLKNHIRDLCGRIHREFIRAQKLSILINVYNKKNEHN